jgi:hypothetical protein
MLRTGIRRFSTGSLEGHEAAFGLADCRYRGIARASGFGVAG